MARFLLRSIVSTVITMLLVSMILFFLLEVSGRDVTVQILGVFATDEQRESLSNQLGLDQPAWLRYVDWLAGSDWRADDLVGYPLVTMPNARSGEDEWWARVDDRLMRWEIGGEGELVSVIRQEEGGITRENGDDFWRADEEGNEFFWGVDNQGRAAQWVRGSENVAFVATQTGVQEVRGAAQDWIPLRKGMIRGDPGESLQTNRPVSNTLPTRIRNTVILAATAFIVVMPLALVLGIIAGINEGKILDRIISVTSLGFTATPEFVTGVFLILIFGVWLQVLPAVAIFSSDNAIFENPLLLVLPVLTLTAVELGYVARMTRASMVEVMNAPYIRTAIIKGMPFNRVVFGHALRNALMAPITIIMLHVNWLIGGVVVVEVLFGYPGLGSYIYDAAIFGDPNAVQAAAMVTVLIAVATRLLGDIAYTYLNPRIRYS
ncbi:MAG: ABC transporter permease [Chloroflexota bacterium]